MMHGPANANVKLCEYF